MGGVIMIYYAGSANLQIHAYTRLTNTRTLFCVCAFQNFSSINLPPLPPILLPPHPSPSTFHTHTYNTLLQTFFNRRIPFTFYFNNAYWSSTLPCHQCKIRWCKESNRMVQESFRCKSQVSIRIRSKQ